MKVGDYVRNEHFGIGKINKDYYDSDNKHWYNVKFNCYGDDDCHCGINEKTIGFKSSPNIIDLIEVGDYVNGCLIVEINKDPFIKGQTNLWTNMIISEGEPFPNEYYKAKIIKKDIKSIVTKEQFEAIKYRIGE